MSSTKQGAHLVWSVSVVKSAQKHVDKLPARDFSHIDAAIERLRIDPFAGDLVRLTNGEAAYRRRVGDYRILFDVFRDRRHVDVVAVLRRTTTTYRKRNK